MTNFPFVLFDEQKQPVFGDKCAESMSFQLSQVGVKVPSADAVRPSAFAFNLPLSL